MIACPSDDGLRQIGHDSLPTKLFAEFDAHLRDCSDCQQRLGQIAKEIRVTERKPEDQTTAWETTPEIPGFEIDRQIGRGGMGVVFRAWDHTLERTVALKLMPCSSKDGISFRKRWKTEARLFAKVQHPHVVSLYDIGCTDCWLYLVLEYVAGGSLADHLDGPLPQTLAASWGTQIARAVQNIHDSDILHLDLKPANILIDPGTETSLDRAILKVSDFGIARLRLEEQDHGNQAETTLNGPWGGTRSYMPPEQFRGARHDLTPRTDVYAIGAILYQFLTGRPPFHGVTMSQTFEMVQNQEPVPPRRLNPQVSRDLETITLKCLQKEPGRRYASAAALADDLTRFLEGRPILARPVSYAERGWRWCRRRPALASTLAALAATLVIGILAILVLYSKAINERVRAQAALEREIKNHRIAVASLESLHKIVYGTLTDHPLRGEQLVKAASVLREQIAKSRIIEGSQQPFPVLGGTNKLLAERLKMTRRLNDASAVMRDEIAHSKISYFCDRADQQKYWDYVEGLVTAAAIEIEAGRLHDAFDYLKEAAGVVKTTHLDGPLRVVSVARVSAEFRSLEKVLSTSTQTLQALQVKSTRRSLWPEPRSLKPDRPDHFILQACLFADDGAWFKAHVLAETVIEKIRSIDSHPTEVRRSLRDLTEDWILREVQHWHETQGLGQTRQQEIDSHAKRMLEQIKAAAVPLDLTSTRSKNVSQRLLNVFGGLAARERRAGRLEIADRVVALHSSLAQCAIQEFPTHAGWFLLLSEAYMQRSKNAWKRNSIADVRVLLKQSIDELMRGALLDPDDSIISNFLIDHIGRLARLPKS